MTVKAFASGGTRKVRDDLPTGNLVLNLTAERSALKDGEASVIVGRNVLVKGSLSRAPGRRPVNVAFTGTMLADLDLNLGGHPLTTAIPSNMQGLFTNRLSMDSGPLVSATTGDQIVWENVTITKSTGRLSLTATGAARYGELSRDMLDPQSSPRLIFNDLFPPVGAIQSKTISNSGALGPRGTNDLVAQFIKGEFYHGNFVRTTDQENTSFAALFASFRTFRFTVSWVIYYDKRGLWVSNGRKFWLLQNSAYIEYLDLGPNSGALGTEWHGSQVSPTVFMFVAPKQPPRIIPLNALPRVGAISEVDGTKYLGGLLPPDLPETVDAAPQQLRFATPDQIGADPTTQTVLDSSSSSGIAQSIPFDGTERIKMRVVDDRTGAMSAFVDVSKANDRVNTFQLITGQSGVLLIIPELQYRPPDLSNYTHIEQLAFRTARGTHIEFWRTTGGGLNFFRELRKALAWPVGSFLEGYAFNIQYSTMMERPPFTDPPHLTFGRHMALNLDDTNLIFRTQLDPVIERLGGLPPSCRDIIAINGCTIAGGASNGVINVLMQGKTLRWPRVAFDEQLLHSELNGGLDVVAPESFHASDRRTLARQGDTFQRFASTGKLVIAVFKNGAYRVERAATSLDIKPLGDSGVGTPWPDGVLSAGKFAIWVSPSAVHIYDQEGESGAGSLRAVEHGPMLRWFLDALEGQRFIDAGYDDRFGTLHLRRSVVTRIGGNTAGADSVEADQLITRLGIDTTDPVNATNVPIEWSGSGGVATATPPTVKYTLESAAVFNLRTGQWTLVEDDTGFKYCWAARLEKDDNTYRLYTIDQTGALFEENYTGLGGAYDGFTVQDTIRPGAYTAESNNILSSTGPCFSSLMLGDAIRFRSTNPILNGQVRTIKAANTGQLTFDPLPALGPGGSMVGTEFIIGAQPFRVRWAPVLGDVAMTIKTVKGCRVNARPGARHVAGSAWGDRPTGKLTVRAYRDLSDAPLAETATVEIFGDKHAQFKTGDREAAVSPQGNSLEIEIECLDARTDFVLDAAVVSIEEEGDLAADQSSSV